MAQHMTLCPEVQTHRFKGLVVRSRVEEGVLYFPAIDVQNLLMCKISAQALYNNCASTRRIQFYQESKSGLLAIEAWDAVNICKARGHKTIDTNRQEKIDWLKSLAKEAKLTVEVTEENEMTSSLSIQTFSSSEFGKVRVATTERGEPMFCLSDICEILGIKNSRDVKSRLSPKGVDSIDTLTSQGNQKITFIDEPNLYRCVFQSRKPEAERFQEWVVKDVLPSIRKHGIYATEEKIEMMINNPDFAIKLLEALKEEKKAAQLAKDEVKRISHVLGEQNVAVKRMRPKEQYYDAVIEDRELYSTNQIAGELNISYPALRLQLLKAGIITSMVGKLEPEEEYAHWMEETKSGKRTTLKWNKEGRNGIFSILNPELPK